MESLPVVPAARDGDDGGRERAYKGENEDEGGGREEGGRSASSPVRAQSIITLRPSQSLSTDRSPTHEGRG